MQNLLRMDVIGNSKVTKEATKLLYDKILSSMLFLYCLFMPFEEALASSLGSILRIIALAIIIYSLMVYFNKKIDRKAIRYVIPFAIWMLYAIISVLWSDSISRWQYFIKIYGFQLLFLIVVVSTAKKINIDYLRYGLISAAFIASCLLIFFPSLSSFTDEGRRTIILFEREFDPNILASIIILGIFMSLYYSFMLQKKRILYKIIAAVEFIGLLFTGSRGALISFVFGFFMMEILEIKTKKQRKNAIFLLLTSCAILYIAYMVLPTTLLQARFSKETIFGLNEYADGAHNRYTIWENALIIFFKKPLLGWGCGNFFNGIATVYKECASHNLYILLLVEYGIVGFMVFAYGLMYILKTLKKLKLSIQFAAQISICVMSLTLDSIPYKYFWVCLMLSILTILGRERCENQ